DTVMLHPGFGPAAIAAARDRVRTAAEEAGREPDRVQVWACLVVLPDQPEDLAFTKLVRRFTGYMAIPGYGDAIVRANGWDLAVLDRIRAEPLLSADSGPEPFDSEVLRRVTEIYPTEWLAEAGAIGSADACAAKIVQQFEAG